MKIHELSVSQINKELSRRKQLKENNTLIELMAPLSDEELKNLIKEKAIAINRENFKAEWAEHLQFEYKSFTISDHAVRQFSKRFDYTRKSVNSCRKRLMQLLDSAYLVQKSSPEVRLQKLIKRPLANDLYFFSENVIFVVNKKKIITTIYPGTLEYGWELAGTEDL